MLRPPLSEERLKELSDGTIALQLRRRFRDGTTHILFSPQEFVEKLVTMIPRPRSHLIRYHGILGPASKWRAQVVPGSGRTGGKRSASRASHTEGKQEAAPDLGTADGLRPSPWIPWAELLRRIFAVDALSCPKCAGQMRILAVVTGKAPIEAILSHLGVPCETPRFAPARAPPKDETWDQGWAE